MKVYSHFVSVLRVNSGITVAVVGATGVAAGARSVLVAGPTATVLLVLVCLPSGHLKLVPW